MIINQNEQDLKKLKITSSVYLIAIICFLFIVVSAYFDQTKYFIQALAALFITTTCYVIVKKTNDFKLVIYINIGFSVLINIIGFITGSYIGNHGSIFWVINFTLFAFYTVGKKGALFYMIFNVSCMIIVKSITSNHLPLIIDDPFLNSSYPELKYIINMLACTIIFVFLIDRILKDFESSQLSLQESNNALKLNTQEKTTMIREIHHRVKNNLQVIISLLRLQLYKIDKDDAITDPFKDSIHRISTMALIHEELYRGDKVNDLDLQFYLKNLCEDLIKSYATTCMVKTSIQTDVHRMHMDDMVPLSLIMNELITNSIKHGFKNKKDGVISIQIKKQEDGINLQYHDTGEWIPPSEPNSFGIELIETLIEHFDGSYGINTAQGTEFNFKLKLIDNFKDQ